MSCYFLGKGPFSKSLLLRAFLVQNYFPKLQITGDSKSDDVKALKKGLQTFNNNSININCLQSAAVLRFLVLRASRETGIFVFTGSSRLLERPFHELQVILNQLSCSIKKVKNNLVLNSQGWNLSGDSLNISGSRSSQFASGVFLNSWNLKQDLFITIEGEIISSAYFKMTLLFLQSLGMQIKQNNQEFCIPAKQKINSTSYNPEADMSCLFSLAAMTIFNGEVIFTDWPKQSLQPDFIFTDILQQMNFSIQYIKNTLKIKGSKKLKPIKYNIKNCCDVFPVLAALCALAEGTSHIYGAPHLIYKESNRIKLMAELLNKIGIKIKILEDGLIIEGKDVLKKQSWPKNIIFNPQEDHRIAMAAAVLKQAGFLIQILNPEVVNKSFPDFWSIVGSQ